MSDARHDPAALARHYTRFRVSERLLLNGHSHQAWPDVAFQGQQQAWLDAAEHVDDKWARAFEQADRVRLGFGRLLGEPDPVSALALGANTHELVVRFLSALPLRTRPRLLTTTGEFHTLRRQLDRVREEGVPVDKLDARPVATLAERLAAAVDERTAAVLVSSVLYETGELVPHLGAVAMACTRHGAELLVDAYHHLNVVPFDLEAMGLTSAFVTGGGYKYCQLGEGNAFLRVPPGHDHLRPVVTGWFGEFAELEAEVSPGAVRYGRRGARFAGATYDPTSHYRGAAVFDFFAERGLTAEVLRAISRRQVARLAAGIREAAPELPLPGWDADGGVEEGRGAAVAGFLAVRTRDADSAARLTRGMRERGVRIDHRGAILRLGPAPYLTDAQLDEAVAAFPEALAAD